jgi:hypothetical protein
MTHELLGSVDPASAGSVGKYRVRFRLKQTVCSRSGSPGERQPEPKPGARSSTRRMTVAPP